MACDMARMSLRAASRRCRGREAGDGSAFWQEAAASLVLIANLPWVTLVRFAVWLVVGLAIYWLYSQRKSYLRCEPLQTP